MTRPRSGTQPVAGRLVNPDVWLNIFHEARLLLCLIEIFKNGFDWGAQMVNLVTNQGREHLRHIDDGQGMNAPNRMAFLAVGYSTAGGDQSGTFGTGAKKIIFTYASYVCVVTAPEDEPDKVYFCEFTPRELAEAYSGQGEVSWRSEPKTAQNWPHEHPFGTDITYTLENPASRSIYRDTKLAERLSARLDYAMMSMVFVNGQALPPKKLSGRVYRLELPAGQNPAMGRISLEFYRPSKRSSEEDLHMTGRSIGEVSFRDTFVKYLLSDEQRERIPELFFSDEVCGLITAGFLNDHITEKRDSYDAGIADDERVEELIRLLKSVEADVAEHLGIKLRKVDPGDTRGMDDIEAFLDRLTRRFQDDYDVLHPTTNTAGEGEDQGGSSEGGSHTGGGQGKSKLPRIIIERSEFALDERIVVKLEVPEGSPEDFHFYLDASLAKTETFAVGRVELIATELGRGMVRAVNPKTGQAVKAEYEVVTERRFRLSVPGPISVEVGSSFSLEAVNADKLTGSLVWELVEGRGELKVTSKGLMARFTPTAVGRCQIRASDQANPGVYDVCDIRAVPGKSTEAELAQIRDQLFTIEYRDVDTHAFRKLATIIPAGEGEVHKLVFNRLAPGFDLALQQGTLPEALGYSLSIEFAKHFCVEWDEVDPADIQSILLDIQNEAAALYQDMMTQ